MAHSLISYILLFIYYILEIIYITMDYIIHSIIQYQYEIGRYSKIIFIIMICLIVFCIRLNSLLEYLTEKHKLLGTREPIIHKEWCVILTFVGFSIFIGICIINLLLITI